MKTIGIDISVLNEPQKTGIGVYAYYLIKYLLKKNKKDKFILFGISTYSNFNFLKNTDLKNFPNVSLKIVKLPARLFRTAFKIWQFLGWPPIELLIGKVDIYQTFNWYLPPLKKGKIVATVFDMTPLMFPNLHVDRTVELNKILMERINKKADVVITISQNTKKDFLKFYPKKRVEVIYPAANQKVKFKVKNSLNILNKYNLNKSFYLSVSTLEPRKNLLNLIKAYEESGVNEPLVLVGGKGWKNEELLNLVKKNKKIKVTGFVPDEHLIAFYKNAKALIYPSFYEGFGIPVLEALMHECPVICSKTSSFPEVGGDAVIYCNPRSVKSIVEAIKKMDQKNIKLNLQKKSKLQAKKFSWEISAQKLNKIYQEL